MKTTELFLAPVLMLELGENQRENNLTGVRKIINDIYEPTW